MDDGCAPPDCCSRCLNHDVVTLNGHKNKRNCQYIDCNCEKCLLSANHRAADAGQTAICGTEEQDRSRELNALLPALDIPESFGLTFASFKEAMLHDTDFLQQALDAGMDINKPLYPYGPTPLYVAVTDGRRRIAEYLLDKGANINVKDSCGYTPLMKAVLRNDIECTELLAEKGACVNEQSYVWGKSCLHMACENGNINLARILLKHGANINARSAHGSTPLHCVVQNYPTTSVIVELCKLLIGEGADLNGKDSHGRTPLMLAVLKHQIECAELFLEKGACINEQHHPDGKSCLHMACDMGNIDLARILIRSGANINARSDRGYTPLHCVVEFPPTSLVKVELCKQLIGGGADLDAKDLRGYTPLMKAVSTSQIEFTEHLLKIGACVNEHVDGVSCLHMACEIGNIELARILIRHGANVNARNVVGSTPLHYMAKHSPRVFVAVELCKLLIVEGADVNAKDTRGCTPLHNAIMALQYAWADNSTVDWLIHNGARVDITNNNNQTPFHLAQEIPQINAIMVKYITKIRVAGLRVGVSSEIVDQDMRVKYLEEMEQIKSTKINETQTLDVLFSNTIMPIYLLTSTAFIENIMATPTLEEIFPHYASLLRIQYKLARERFDLLNLANTYLEDHRNVTYLHKLPNELRETILEYLNNEELKSLIKSLNISQAMDD